MHTMKSKLGIALFLILFGCDNGTKNTHPEKMNITYYESFYGYSHPLKLATKIDKDKALTSNSYVVGYYDDAGVLLIVERYVEGKVFFRHSYSYNDAGSLVERRSVNVEGTVVVEKM